MILRSVITIIIIIIIIIIILLQESFHINVSGWSFTKVWATANLLKSSLFNDVVVWMVSTLFFFFFFFFWLL